MSWWSLAAILTRAAWVGGFLLSVVVGLLWFFQEKLVFYPAVPKGYETPDKNPKGLHHPGERNLPYEDVYIRTSDGLTLHGWLLRQPNARQAPTFLYFHGNAGSSSVFIFIFPTPRCRDIDCVGSDIGFRLPNLELMFRMVGVNILIISYRGYGYSEGSPTEEGVYTDAEAALDFLLENKTVNNRDIFVFGRSIGGAVAIELARRRSDELKGIVVENTFTSLLEMLYIVFPFLGPFNLLVKAVQSCGARLKLREDVENGGHNDTWEVGGQRYYNRLREFVQVALPASTSSEVSRASGAHSTISDTSTDVSLRRLQCSSAAKEKAVCT